MVQKEENKYLPNFTIYNSNTNNFIKNDKKLSADKQQNRETLAKGNQMKSDYKEAKNAT